MADFTYEYENKNTVLERYEWDNLWLDSTQLVDIPRVLYIGDSISCGTRGVATRVANQTLLFDGLGTSKAVDNPYFADTIRIFAKQQRNRVAVLFNNGLHGWHLDDEDTYGKHYEEMLQFLLQEFPTTPIFLLLTTAVADPERNARVVARNKAVLKLAAAYHLPVIDLYAIVDQHRELISDGVHLQEKGYELLAEEIIKHVNTCLPVKEQ